MVVVTVLFALPLSLLTVFLGLIWVIEIGTIPSPKQSFSFVEDYHDYPVFSNGWFRSEHMIQLRRVFGSFLLLLYKGPKIGVGLILSSCLWMCVSGCDAWVAELVLNHINTSLRSEPVSSWQQSWKEGRAGVLDGMAYLALELLYCGLLVELTSFLIVCAVTSVVSDSLQPYGL